MLLKLLRNPLESPDEPKFRCDFDAVSAENTKADSFLPRFLRFHAVSFEPFLRLTPFSVRFCALIIGGNRRRSKIKLTNKTIARVLANPGVRDVLEACGFAVTTPALHHDIEFTRFPPSPSLPPSLPPSSPLPPPPPNPILITQVIYQGCCF